MHKHKHAYMSESEVAVYTLKRSAVGCPIANGQEHSSCFAYIHTYTHKNKSGFTCYAGMVSKAK